MRIRARWIAAAAALALSPGLAGCGEKPEVTVYQQGKYQGKPDSLPWDNAEFKKDQQAWEKAIKARTNGQDDYFRIAGK
jgi:predicted small lipoprotein YifL